MNPLFSNEALQKRYINTEHFVFSKNLKSSYKQTKKCHLLNKLSKKLLKTTRSLFWKKLLS
ncbi:unnamed protein product [Mucor circinelloides]